MNPPQRRRTGTSRSVLAVLALAGGVALAGCAAGQQAQTARQRPTVDGQNVNVGSIALRDIALAYPAAGIYRTGDDARLELVVVNEGFDGDTLTAVRTDAADEVRITAAAAGGTGFPTPTPSETSIGPSSTPTGTASGTPTGTREPQTPSGSAGPGEPSDDPSASRSGSSESPVPSPTGSATPTGEPVASIQIPRNGLVSFRDEGPTIELVGLTRQMRPAELLTVTFVFQNAGETTVTVTVGTPRGEVSLAPTVPSVEDDNEG